MVTLSFGRRLEDYRVALPLSWAATLLLIGAVAYADQLVGLGTSGLVAHFAVLISIGHSLLVTTFRSRVSPGGLTVLLGTPVMAIAAFFTAPDVGHGGQVLSFVGWTMALTLGLTAALAGRLGKAGPARSAIMRTLLCCQLGVVVIGLLIGVLGPLNPVQGERGGVKIHSCRIGTTPSYPLIEGSRAFVVTTEGLQVLDLDRMRLVATVPLPNPEPGDLKIAGRRFEGTPYESGIRRLGSGPLEVSFRWTYLTILVQDPPPLPLYVHVQVDTDVMSVTSWVVDTDPRDQRPWTYPYSASVGPYDVRIHRIHNSCIAEITGPGTQVEFRLGTDPVVHLAPVDQGLLVLANRGSVYLILLPVS